MKKVLAICSSTIQIMSVLNMKNTVYVNDKLDIVFTDTLNGYKQLASNSNKYKIFNNAYIADCFDLSRRRGKYVKKKLRDNIVFLKNRRTYVEEILPLDSGYDVLMFNNIDDFTSGVYDYLYRKNKDLKLYLFEDGYSTYCVQGTSIIDNIERNRSYLRRIINMLLGVRPAVLNIDGQYLQDCDGIEWTSYFNRYQVPKFNPDNIEMVQQLNQLYEIKNLVDTYDEPVIFFEESYRTEGIPIKDIEIVEKIASWIGKENIMVKIHPRNKENIYKKLGYKTNVDTSIPWEIIYLNHPEMENKLLISVASGSIATPYTMLGKEPHSIALVNMPEVNPSGWVSDYYSYLSRKIFEQRPDIFFCPRDAKTLRMAIENFMKSQGGNYENSSTGTD